VAATAAGWFPLLTEACVAMAQPSSVRNADPSARAEFDRDYQIFLAMHRHRREIDAI
jgi:ribulose kinase